MNGTPLRVIVPHGTILPKIPAIPGITGLKNSLQPLIIFLLLLLIWLVSPVLIQRIEPTADTTSFGVWILVILSLIVFLIIQALCWWLFNFYWQRLGLPPVTAILSHFNTLSLWQQLMFLWVSFASLLLAALGCLISIC